MQSNSKVKPRSVAEIARKEYMDALKAFHDLKVDPNDLDGEDEEDMVTARLRDFMKPTYWQSLNQSVQAKAGMLKRYRNTQHGSDQYAAEIGRKYAQS